MVIDYMIIK